MFALVLAAPFALQREFSRNYAFAHLHVAKALMLDLKRVPADLNRRDSQMLSRDRDSWL
jgi:hypothetical protein